MDVQAFIDEIQNNRGFDDISAADILSVLNDTYHEFCATQPWPFLEKVAVVSTVNGDNAPFAAVTDIRSVLAMVDTTNGYPIPKIRWDELIKTYASALDETGNVIFWYKIGESFRVHPIPGEVSNLYLAYLCVEPELEITDLTADILIPARHQRILLHGALARLYQLNDDAESSVFQQNIYDQRMVRATNDLWADDYGTPAKMTDVYEQFD